MTTEKGLAEKVMFAIHIDSFHEVEKYYADYLEHIGFLGKKKDMKLLEKMNIKYASYQINKAKGIFGDENEVRF